MGGRGRRVALRIAFYHNHPPGGAARALFHVCAALGQRHTIDAFTLTTAEGGDAPSVREVRRFEFAPHAPARFGLYLNELRAHRDIERLRRVNRDAAEAIDRGGYDVVLASACRFAQAPPVLEYLATPSVYFCHEPPRRFIDPFCRPEAYERGAYLQVRRLIHAPAHRIVERAWQRTDRRAAGGATALLTNSRFTQGRIRAYYRREATVAHLGVDSAAFGEATRDGDYVLSVGAIEHHKGFDFLIGALSRMPASSRPALMLVGGTANESVLRGLRALAAAGGVDLRVRLRLSERELAGAYRHARAFAYSPRLEPFGLVVLEAMASALPVVAVAEGGVVESVDDGETGVLVARDEHAFADALAGVLGDEARGMRLGTAARQRARETWTWEAAAGRVEAALEATRRRPDTAGAGEARGRATLTAV